MFKNISTWEQKKLNGINFVLNLLYFVLTFISPLAIVIVNFYKIGDLEETKKAPMMFIIIAVAIIFAMMRFFKKAIAKISILNIDGSYNIGAQWFKHILETISKLIIPIVILVISVVFSTALHEYIDFYLNMVIWCLAFFIAGSVLDNLIIAFLDDEIALREKVKEQNAISRRASLR